MRKPHSELSSLSIDMFAGAQVSFTWGQGSRLKRCSICRFGGKTQGFFVGMGAIHSE